MHEMMQQVSILRNHSRVSRIGIIGAKDCRYLRMLLKSFFDTLESPRREYDIRIYEQQDFALCVSGATVSGNRWSRIHAKSDKADSHLGGDKSRAVSGPIVHDDDLCVV